MSAWRNEPRSGFIHRGVSHLERRHAVTRHEWHKATLTVDAPKLPDPLPEYADGGEPILGVDYFDHGQ